MLLAVVPNRVLEHAKRYVRSAANALEIAALLSSALAQWPLICYRPPLESGELRNCSVFPSKTARFVRSSPVDQQHFVD
jgi:hypothetical protein